MAQTSQLLDTLKKSLKAYGKTYADVARALDLTEASVKRLFSEQGFSLQRLDQICNLLKMEISDLVQLMHASHTQLQQLREEQEQEIASDLVLLLVTVCVLNRWTMADIVSFYTLSETECIRKLARLDKLEIIELLPKNKIKLLVAPNFHWRENGPIQCFFQTQIEQEYFKTRFDKPSEKLVVINGMLSPNSNAVFQRKMEKLAREFDELNNEDAPLPLTQRAGSTVVIAMRDWTYDAFEHLVEQPPEAVV